VTVVDDKVNERGTPSDCVWNLWPVFPVHTPCCGHYVKTGRHSQNRKCTTHCIVDREPRYGRSKHARKKFREVPTCGCRDMSADTETDIQTVITHPLQYYAPPLSGWEVRFHILPD